MWNNYGKIFAEYIFIKNFRKSKINNEIKLLLKIKNELEKLKKSSSL